MPKRVRAYTNDGNRSVRRIVERRLLATRAVVRDFDELDRLDSTRLR